jgi:hypothetical protein
VRYVVYHIYEVKHTDGGNEMTLAEAKLNYLNTKAQYQALCETACPRQIRRDAFAAYMKAEVDLVDVSMEHCESQLGCVMENYNVIIHNPAARKEVAELAMKLE